jgi:hypothetical protein
MIACQIISQDLLEVIILSQQTEHKKERHIIEISGIIIFLVMIYALEMGERLTPRLDYSIHLSNGACDSIIFG